MTSNLLGSVDGSEKLYFIDWNKIGDPMARSYDQGFYAYKIDKFQDIRSIMMVETNNMFHITIFDQWLQ